jgi:predicted alpha/beta hydrolase
VPNIEPTPEPLRFEAADGYTIGGSLWRHHEPSPCPRAVVIINPATSVRSRYYARFAAFLFASGFDVLTYDYRGIGESRPATLRRLDAGWLDWGCLDFEAALRYVDRTFQGRPIHVVAHSIGGVLVGVAESNHLIQRVFTMGAQYAYWRDYAAGQRLRMVAKWHVAMPLVTAAFGYFPGKRLGWLEDTPRGVVRDWASSRERFEEIRRGRGAPSLSKAALQQRFAALTAPILAVSVTDDAFGTIAAIERPLAYFEQSPRTHLRIAPDSVGEQTIGHFGFFHSRFEPTLWQIPLSWLRSGEIASAPTGIVISTRPGRP